MKYAIVRMGGKQIKISENSTFEIEAQKDLTPEVLIFSDGKKVQIGTPTVDKVKVELEKLSDKRDKKVDVIRFKAKSRYKKKRGHKQPISVIKVRSIEYGA